MLGQRHPDPKMSCHYLNLQNKEIPNFSKGDWFGERYSGKHLNLQQEYTEAEEGIALLMITKW